MNLTNFETKRLFNIIFRTFLYNSSETFKTVIDEIYIRLCSPKQPYQIKYKFLPNDRDIDDMKALTVWGTSPLAACQTLVDANDWRGQYMQFVVTRDDVNYHYMSHDLE